eukprot:TRINITY_DN863_c0_g1_i4.p1 TRINITY_DN863_c0_g1~~TRINITY_DN863_c0_g1_i4.p1  ORF type:complete len:301 (+),score=34.22 TRINITY_DN863_c0_g1_i4:71-973(+)
MVSRFLPYLLVASSCAHLASGVSMRPVQLAIRYSQAEEEIRDVEKEGFAVVIPGVANQERAELVAKNVQWLKGQGLPFECWMFVYLSSEELPLDESDYEPCQIIRHEGFWLGHILALPLNMTSKPWVLHLMDSIEPQANVNLREWSNIMLANGLGFSSVTFDTSPDLPEATKNKTRLYPIMARQPDKEIGRFVDFIELHFNLFSRKYFACLQDLIDLDNTMGWGVDHLLASLCGGSAETPVVMAGRMGVIDKMTMVKFWAGSYYSHLDEVVKGLHKFKRKHREAHKTNFSSFGDLLAPTV